MSPFFANPDLPLLIVTYLFSQRSNQNFLCHILQEEEIVIRTVELEMYQLLDP
jgi:hypothetical protein